MSFSFLAPQFLWAFLAVPAILVLHFVRKRRKKRMVSALFLWKEAQNIAQSQKRFSATWLLLLQLAFASLAALALSRPVFAFSGKQDRVFIVDGSASMAAKDIDGIRLNKALKQAEEVLKESANVSLIRAGLEATVVSPLSANHQEISRALKSIKAYDKRADLNRAVSLAKSLAPRAEIHIFSDSEIKQEDDLVIHSLASESLNIGIVAFDIAVQEAFISIAGNHPRPQDVDILLLRNSEPIAKTKLLLPSRGQASTSFPLLDSSGLFELQIQSFPWDGLDLDNKAFISKADLVVVAREDNEALKRSFKAIPNLNYRVSTNLNLNAPSFDLRVLYGKLPNDAKGNYLLFNKKQEEPKYESIKDWDRTDALLRFVDLNDILVAPEADFMGDWQVLAQTESLTPVISRYKDEDLNVVALNFNPAQTNMTKRTAFPLLITNIVSYFRNLKGLELGQSLAENAFYLDNGKEILTKKVDKPGFYKIDDSIFAASLLSAKETSLASFSANPETETKNRVANDGEGRIVRILAWWFMIIAFILILLEWLLWSQANPKSTHKGSFL